MGWYPYFCDEETEAQRGGVSCVQHKYNLSPGHWPSIQTAHHSTPMLYLQLYLRASQAWSGFLHMVKPVEVDEGGGDSCRETRLKNGGSPAVLTCSCSHPGLNLGLVLLPPKHCQDPLYPHCPDEVTLVTVSEEIRWGCLFLLGSLAMCPRGKAEA